MKAYVLVKVQPNENESELVVETAIATNEAEACAMLLDLEDMHLNRERLIGHAAGDPRQLAVNISSDDCFYYVDEHEIGPPAVTSPSTAPSEDECRAFETSLNDARSAERIQDRD